MAAGNRNVEGQISKPGGGALYSTSSGRHAINDRRSVTTSNFRPAILDSAGFPESLHVAYWPMLSKKVSFRLAALGNFSAVSRLLVLEPLDWRRLRPGDD